MGRKYRTYERTQPEFNTWEELFSKLGYKDREPDRGLSVVGIRKNKRETVLSLASASSWSISWLQKQLDKHLGFKPHYKHKRKDSNGKS